ncbi:SDR family NAD(P)-dependent oxidoreductase [Flavobacteriaceae bacterium F89]|uniref:SDR family NAD(P)-dependent oxidoreductase n=1 Tax=Cerina litoralis TaxID=2874477 RepID=A0AAE3JNT9_9FLAO|nr:SDR family NAD(P)-dependent oxidoreductase [Cerina litoralis]MCG2460276.1 SDR family NAD(P)-dependent oxidoreductase [Cerina litoralis]
MDIDSKIAVVTGASRGLGAALSSSLVAKGATVYGLSRNRANLADRRAKLGENFVPVSLDITDQTAVHSWVSETFSNLRSPDILINNAGTGHFGKIDELSLEQWHGMLNTNLNGLFYVTSQIVPFMKRKKDTCHIVNLGSILGKTGRAEGAAYCLTKYGVQGFSEALFRELRSEKIKVSCVNPGSIATHFFRDSGIEPHGNMIQPKNLADLIVQILETPDNLLIDEITIRPLIPKPLG